MDLILYFVLSAALVAGYIVLVRWAYREDSKHWDRIRKKFDDIISYIEHPHD